MLTLLAGLLAAPGLPANTAPTLKFRHEAAQALAVTDDYKSIVFHHPARRPTELHVVGMTDNKRRLTIPWDKDWGEVGDAVMSPTGGHLAVLAKPLGGLTTLKVIDLAPGEVAINVRQSLVEYGVFSPDGSKLATVGGGFTNRDGTGLWLWDVATKRHQAVEVSHRPSCLAFSPDGRRVVCGIAQGRLSKCSLQVMDLRTGRKHAEWPAHADDLNVTGVAYSPDGRRIASVGKDGVLAVWDADTGKKVAEAGDPQEVVYSVAYHPSGRYLATAGQDKTIRLWQADPLTVVATAKTEKIRYHLRLRFTQSGDTLVGKERLNAAVLVWDVGGIR